MNNSGSVNDAVSPAIVGFGQVRPQATPGPLKLPEGLAAGMALAHRCPDPLEKDIIPGLTWRRLGRAQKLALMAAQLAFKEVHFPPAAGDRAAVCLGTGLGELGETAAFLENLVRLEEREPKPTRFTNSVHNSLASQVAIQFKLAGENHTITHGPISFELALWQAWVLLQTGRAEYVLAGGVDELNPYAAYAGAELGLWSLGPTPGAGVFPGEGAAAFLLGRGKAGRGVARLQAVRVGPITSTDPQAEVGFLRQALATAGLDFGDLDLILTGANSEAQLRERYLPSLTAFFRAGGREIPYGLYKHRCGEFCSAPALGLAWAVEILQRGRISPELMIFGGREPTGPNHILLYQRAHPGFHSVCLVGR